VMKAGSCAAEGYEPRQVREEAAVSNILRAPQGSLAGAGCTVSTCCPITILGHGLIRNLKAWKLLNGIYFILPQMAAADL